MTVFVPYGIALSLFLSASTMDMGHLPESEEKRRRRRQLGFFLQVRTKYVNADIA
jgi:hypothetical protein